jgi:hypothetical protein
MRIIQKADPAILFSPGFSQNPAGRPIRIIQKGRRRVCGLSQVEKRFGAAAFSQLYFLALPAVGT